jgi:hypothetical protein
MPLKNDRRRRRSDGSAATGVLIRKAAGTAHGLFRPPHLSSGGDGLLHD